MILAPFIDALIDKLSTKPLLMSLIIIEIVTACMLLSIAPNLLVLVFIRIGVGSAYFQQEFIVCSLRQN
ncbi:MAG: hypothetical protein LBS39_00115 [Campylobacteraceae bacterium]|nr:hypothetical protein [Campylobacteraceae bacterium]